MHRRECSTSVVENCRVCWREFLGEPLVLQRNQVAPQRNLLREFSAQEESFGKVFESTYDTSGRSRETAEIDVARRTDGSEENSLALIRNSFPFEISVYGSSPGRLKCASTPGCQIFDQLDAETTEGSVLAS